MKRKKIRVGILFGGRSAEHEVSLQSAKNVIGALDREKYDPVLIGIDKKGQWYLQDTSQFLLHETNPKLIALNTSTQSVSLPPWKITDNITPIDRAGTSMRVDVVFPVLHGPYGEDGTIQGLLKLANIPFVGASVLGSAIGMDKDVMKRLLKEARIPIANCLVIHEKDRKNLAYDVVKKKLNTPFFVKPANLGSSVGVSKVTSKKEFTEAINEAFLYDTKILIEEYIDGREIECSVLGDENPIASVAGEIVPTKGFYSYNAKYIDQEGAMLICPANIDKKILRQIQKLAIKTFNILCCNGMARVDFFLTKDGRIYVNEINTIPGFTKISMYPRLWRESGVEYSMLIDRLITLAFRRYEKEQRLKTTKD